MKVSIIFGTRPEIIKLAFVVNKLRQATHADIVFTGQHYDYNMSTTFIKELNLPDPDYILRLSDNPFVTLSETKGLVGRDSSLARRSFAESTLSGARFFATLRMTESEGFRMTIVGQSLLNLPHGWHAQPTGSLPIASKNYLKETPPNIVRAALIFERIVNFDA
jgi:hypothetical protein